MNKKIANAAAERLFLSRGIFKMQAKTLLKINPAKKIWQSSENIDQVDNFYGQGICSDNIRVNVLENIICQSYFGKDSLANFI